MPRIAFATSRALTDLTPSDRLGRDALQRAGAVVIPAVWNDRTVDWSSFDQVVVRSPWDYFHHRDDFRAWFDQLDRAGVPVENPTRVLRWNLDKAYLRELGVPTVATHWVERGATADLAGILRERGWEKAVIKPTISGGAVNTWVTSPAEAMAHQPRLAPLLAECGLMIQPFMPEIQSQGEWSLLFFRKQFSHAVEKRPTGGDFRVQVEHGGTTTAAEPTAALLAQAQRVVDVCREPLLYARVDGLDLDGEFQLMEFEVLEPDLFLGYAEGAPERFAAAVLGR